MITIASTFITQGLTTDCSPKERLARLVRWLEANPEAQIIVLYDRSNGTNFLNRNNQDALNRLLGMKYAFGEYVRRPGNRRITILVRVGVTLEVKEAIKIGGLTFPCYQIENGKNTFMFVPAWLSSFLPRLIWQYHGVTKRLERRKVKRHLVSARSFPLRRLRSRTGFTSSDTFDFETEEVILPPGHRFTETPIIFARIP